MQNLKRNFILIRLIVLFSLSLLILPAQAASNDILVYYTTDIKPSKIYPLVGFNTTNMIRAAENELTSALLSGYGQVWVIDAHHVYADLTPVIDFTPAEIAAIGAFRASGGGLMLSAFQQQGQDRANQLAQQFNNGNNIYAGNLVVHTPPPVLTCINSAGLLHLTWVGYPTIHPLYLGLDPFPLVTRMHDTVLNVNPASGIEITAKVGVALDDYGAVLDDGAGGRIVFDNCGNRFMIEVGNCTVAEETQYQQNIADWLGAGSVSPTPALPPISGGLIPCGRKTDNPDTPNVDERDECTVCHFFLMIKNIMDFITKIAVIVAILFIAIGGIMYVLSTGNEAMLSKAKAMITYAIIGFILIFAAWLMIELILSTFGYTNPLGGEWDVIC